MKIEDIRFLVTLLIFSESQMLQQSIYFEGMSQVKLDIEFIENFDQAPEIGCESGSGRQVFKGHHIQIKNLSLALGIIFLGLSSKEAFYSPAILEKFESQQQDLKFYFEELTVHNPSKQTIREYYFSNDLQFIYHSEKIYNTFSKETIEDFQEIMTLCLADKNINIKYQDEDQRIIYVIPRKENFEEQIYLINSSEHILVTFFSKRKLETKKKSDESYFSLLSTQNKLLQKIEKDEKMFSVSNQKEQVFQFLKAYWFELIVLFFIVLTLFFMFFQHIINPFLFHFSNELLIVQKLEKMIGVQFINI